MKDKLELEVKQQGRMTDFANADVYAFSAEHKLQLRGRQLPQQPSLTL
jgi:hypothetical protein